MEIIFKLLFRDIGIALGKYIIKFPTKMHSDNRQSRVTYEDLHVLKCNNDSNVYILTYFRILKKVYPDFCSYPQN